MSARFGYRLPRRTFHYQRPRATRRRLDVPLTDALFRALSDSWAGTHVQVVGQLELSGAALAAWHNRGVFTTADRAAFVVLDEAVSRRPHGGEWTA